MNPTWPAVIGGCFVCLVAGYLVGWWRCSRVALDVLDEIRAMITVPHQESGPKVTPLLPLAPGRRKS